MLDDDPRAALFAEAQDRRKTRWRRDDRALYVISVAAELAGVHPQTLRIYERKGLLAPARTSGRSRRYSDHDIELLRRIQELTNDGVSLAGVQRILALEDELDAARERDRRARGARRRAAARDASERVEAAHRQYRRELVPLRSAVVARSSRTTDSDERRSAMAARPEPVHPQDPRGVRAPRRRSAATPATPRSRPSTCCARCSISPKAS